jgi:hypothetical protein
MITEQDKKKEFDRIENFLGSYNTHEVMLLPYVNTETQVFMDVSQLAYLAFKTLDMIEEVSRHGLSNVLQMYALPKTARRAFAEQMKSKARQ